MLIPNKHNGYTRDGVRRVFCDGGGGGSSTATTYTSNVPDYAEKPFMENLAKGIALGDAPYQAYGGERAAQFAPLQRQAFGQAGNQQVAGQVGAATGIAGLAGLQGLNAQFDPFQTGQFTSQAAQQYMNPFMQNVVDIQKREAQRASDIAGTQQQAQAVQRGAFGGSRDAIMRAERERNLAQQLGDIQATGSNAAFQAAQDQFNREQGMREASRQFGAEFGMRGGAQALQSAQTLGSLGGQQFGQEMDIMGARERMGGTQQNQIQRILDQQFADFQQQRDYPYQQIGFVSDLLRGSGSSTRSVYPQASPMQQLAGLGTAAYGLSSMGSGSGFRAAKGGEVPHYADGGITGLLSDRELAQTAQNPSYGPMMQMAAQGQMAENAALRNAAPEGLPGMQPQADVSAEAVLTQKMIEALNQGDRELAEKIAQVLEEIKVQQEVGGIAGVMPEQMAEGIPEGGIMEMAMGGEVGYSNGGDIVLPAGTPSWMVEQERMNNPGRQVRVEGEGAFWRGIGRALTYSSDVEAQRAAEQRKVAAESQDATDRMRNQSRKATAEASQGRVAEPRKVEEATKGGPKPDQSGIMGGVGASVMSGAGRPGMLYGSFDAEAARKRGLEDITAAEAKAMGFVDAEEQRHKEFYEKLGLAGTEKEKRLRESLEGIKGEKNQAKSMALFEAGLAMLSADPSRGALAAIGSGAMKALGSYKGDLKDLETRRERMADKLDDLDTLRRQEAIASEEGRKRIAQRREQVTTEFGKEFRLFAKQFNVDIPLEAAKFNAEVALRERTARMARTTETERLRAELTKHKPGSPEYNRILKDVEAIAIAQGAGKPDTSYLRDPQYKSKVDALALVESQLAIPSVANDPKKRQPLEDRARVLRQELEAMSGGRGSSTSQSGSAPTTKQPVIDFGSI